MTSSDDNLKAFSKLCALAIGVFLLTCLRAWLLSLCAAILFPAFALGFWQWWLLAFTFRLMTAASIETND